MKIGVIDIGSNTIKLDIFQVNGSDITNISAESIRGALAKYTMDGFLNDEGYSVLKKILLKFTVDAKQAGCDKTLVFATQSLRGISNADRVCEDIRAQLGVDIDIISGTQEAQCSFFALCDCISDEDSGIMADMGGGSLELVDFENKTSAFMCSLPLGALKVRETLNCSVVPDREQTSKIEEYARSFFDNVQIKKHDAIYIIGGTARAMFSAVFNGKEEIGVDESLVAYEKMSFDAEETEKRLYSLIPKRADSFMTGFAIFNAAAKYFNCKKIVLCKKGVRDGYLKMKLKDEE